jgi:hypothetical protein
MIWESRKNTRADAANTIVISGWFPRTSLKLDAERYCAETSSGLINQINTKKITCDMSSANQIATSV